MHYLSFFVIQTDGDQSAASSGRRFKHFQTLDEEDYEESEIKRFLDEEFVRIVKRKVERNPNTANAPTKIGRFMVEPGYELGSNQNYNLFQRLREADSKERFIGIADELVRIYMDTSAVRGGAFIVALSTLNTFFRELTEVLPLIGTRRPAENDVSAADYHHSASSSGGDDTPPW